MIPLFKADTTRNPLAYNGLTFNQEVTNEKDIIEVNLVTEQSIIEATTERSEFTDGLEVYGAFKRAKRISMFGQVRALSKGALFDKLDQLAAAFDPSRVSLENGSPTFGFLPMTFDVPTADTTTYPSGVIASQYYVRAEAAIEPQMFLKQGLAVPWHVGLLVPDPRRYFQTQQSKSGAGAADNSKASFYSWPTITITMAGAGSATYAIANSTLGRTLTLNLSGLVNTDVVTVNMQTKSIKKNGGDQPDLYVSGDYWWMKPGVSNTLAITNGTNATTVTSWYRAFSF